MQQDHVDVSIVVLEREETPADKALEESYYNDDKDTIMEINPVVSELIHQKGPVRQKSCVEY